MIVELEGIPQVAVEFVNADHRREAELLNALGEAIAAERSGEGKPGAVAARWDALHVHTREHFGREEDAMRRVGFPPYPVHQAEHERVLAEMAAERDHFDRTGDHERLWRYVSEAMPAWFVAHIQSMDQVTAHFIAARGG